MKLQIGHFGIKPQVGQFYHVKPQFGQLYMMCRMKPQIKTCV